MEYMTLIIYQFKYNGFINKIESIPIFLVKFFWNEKRRKKRKTINIKNNRKYNI